MASVVIVGGGISGLSAAYYLAQGGAASTILESRPRLGGVIQTEHVEGCTIEAGPDSFLAAKPAAVELANAVGLGGQVIGSNDHLRKTYVRKGGRLIPLPDGLMMMVPTKILPLVGTRLVSWGTKIRMGMELFRAPKMRPDDESVSRFIAEHYGMEAVDYLAEPLLSGIYGGHPDDLSVRSVLPSFVKLAEQYGSLTRGVLAERARAQAHRNGPPAPLFRTFKGGLGQLVDAVSSAIRGHAVVRQVRAETVERTAAGFRVRAAGQWMESASLVMGCEAHSAAELLRGMDPRLAEVLTQTPYSSSVTIALGFDAADFPTPPEGFGFLVPKKERRRLAACTWVGNKFSFRVPPGKIVARCFIGGAEGPAALAESDETLAAAAATELGEIAGISATPRFTRVFRWPRAMAQPAVGHAARVAEIEQRVAAIPGLHLAGNAYQGIGIPDCIRLGRQGADRILAHAV
ncbi:MAG TPA: protoporphyrinogen oxidase [Verrucomicrobiae bacterium]|nr:protoporphyrinogen oxidase [Verrucomicrobiae bacterium]